MTSAPDRPFQTLSDSDLAARIASNREQQVSLATQRNASAKRVLVLLKQTMGYMVDERSRREMPPSVPDAEYIAAKVAEFDRDFPIPKIDAQPPILTEASRVHEGVDGVCSAPNETAARLPRA